MHKLSIVTDNKTMRLILIILGVWIVLVLLFRFRPFTKSQQIPSVNITIKYLKVKDPALPFPEDKRITHWLQQVEEIIHEVAGVNINFLDLGCVNLHDFFQDKKWNLHLWYESEAFDEALMQQLMAQLKSYDVELLIKKFPSALNSGEFLYEDISTEIKNSIISEIIEKRKIFAEPPNDTDFLRMALTPNWDYIFKNLKNCNMILTNEITGGITFLEGPAEEGIFEFNAWGGLTSKKEPHGIVVSTFLWELNSKFEKKSAVSKDYFIASTILHEIGHAIFSLPDRPYEDGLMNPYLDDNRYYYTKPYFGKTSLSELKVWPYVRASDHFVQKGDMQQAKRYLRMALNIKDDYKLALDSLGDILNREGKVLEREKIRTKIEAVERKEDQINQLSKEMILRHNRAVSFEGVGEYKRAILEYKELLQMDFSIIDSYEVLRKIKINSYLNLGTILTDQTNYDEAIPIFKKLLTTEPKTAIAHYMLGRCYLMMGDNANALQYFTNYLNFEPNNLYSELAKMYISEISERTEINIE